MKLPLGIATKLQQLLQGTESLPASLLKHATVTKMLEDGVVLKKLSGRSKSVLFIRSAEAFNTYLQNQFGIANLSLYIEKLNDEELSRSGAIEVSGNSKLRYIRSFKGFLVNSYSEIEATLHNEPFVVNPVKGAFHFISDYEQFIPHPSVTIVGIENPENFREIHKQQYLFKGKSVLFICRYPQSLDAISWLQSIPNPYLHFGDLDFEGIKIYLNEYKKHLHDRASFFVPPNAMELLDKYGNRDLYNRQLPYIAAIGPAQEQSIQQLLQSFHQHKKVLEQEIFIGYER